MTGFSEALSGPAAIALPNRSRSEDSHETLHDARCGGIVHCIANARESAALNDVWELRREVSELNIRSKSSRPCWKKPGRSAPRDSSGVQSNRDPIVDAVALLKLWEW